MPNAVPQAGGCTVAVTSIRRIFNPTASEYLIVSGPCANCGIKVTNAPVTRPSECPPMTFLGLANGLLGVQNTMNAVAAIDDIITMSRCCRNRNAKNNTKVAAAVCHR